MCAPAKWDPAKWDQAKWDQAKWDQAKWDQAKWDRLVRAPAALAGEVCAPRRRAAAEPDWCIRSIHPSTRGCRACIDRPPPFPTYPRVLKRCRYRKGEAPFFCFLAW